MSLSLFEDTCRELGFPLSSSNNSLSCHCFYLKRESFDSSTAVVLCLLSGDLKCRCKTPLLLKVHRLSLCGDSRNLCLDTLKPSLCFSERLHVGVIVLLCLVYP